MESLLFTGIAMLILLPIMYFLPLGFSMKGKVFIIVTSLFISLLGLLATPFLPLWQLGLVVMLLVGLSAYLMTKKLDRLIETEVAEEYEFTPEVFNEKTFDGTDDTYSHIALSDSKNSEYFNEDETNLLQKAMRQAGDPKMSVLISRPISQAEDDDTDIDFALAEVASSIENKDFETESQPEQEKEENHNYLAEMEDLLVVEEKVPTVHTTSDLDELEEINVDEVKSVPTRFQVNLENELDELEEIPEVEENIVEKLDSKPTSLQQHRSNDYWEDLEELPEIIFEDAEEVADEKKLESESELDEDFWESLLEEDELEGMEEKKVVSNVKK